ncbi:MAG: aldose epimerase family protein [Pseudomonadota bacterium]
MAEVFGTLPDGRAVKRIPLRAGDIDVAVLTYGAILQDVRLTNVNWPVTLGAPDLAPYLGPMKHFGGIVGPVANRISNARFDLDGKTYPLEANDGANCLHGGNAGTNALVWELEEFSETHCVLRVELADGHGGFPGHRTITARYQVSPPAAISLQLIAETNLPTPMNLANHSYWRLGPDPVIEGHRLRILADRVVELDHSFIPTGKLNHVDGSRFDMKEGRTISDPGKDIYDVNFCLSEDRRSLTHVAKLEGPAGLAMDLSTTEPGLQLFTSDTVTTGAFTGHEGVPYGPRKGIALEAQFWPDAPNNPHFPSITLRPGETYAQETVFEFSGYQTPT